MKKCFFAVAALWISVLGFASESLIREYLPSGVDYVTLFDAGKLTASPVYAVMKKSGWELAGEAAGELAALLKHNPEAAAESVMTAGTRKRFLTFVKMNKAGDPIPKILAANKEKFPFFTYPPNSKNPFRVYYGKVYFVPLSDCVYGAVRGKDKALLQGYLDKFSARGRGKEAFLHEMKLLPEKDVFFRAVAFSGNGLFARMPGLQMLRKLSLYAQVPGGDRFYVKGKFVFDDPGSAAFGLQMIKQYQLLSIMVLASGNEVLFGKLAEAFKWSINDRTVTGEFAPDKALCNELIAILAEKGTDVLLSGADPKNLFRMPSRRNKRKE